MRACIIQTTPTNAPILKKHLPPGVTASKERECFDIAGVVEILLEGDGLPDWCKVAELCPIVRGMMDLLEDGATRLVPGGGMPLQQIPGKFNEP